METTSIILIAVFVVCGFVLLWAVKNGNNIKLKKKEKKSKASKTDKFKDIVPKEKPKKQAKVQKISENAKAEKSGKKEAPTNKIVKVTKEDFKNNDMDIPKSLEDKQLVASKPQPEEFKLDINDLNFKDDPTTKLTEDFGLDTGFSSDTWKSKQELGLPPMDDFSLPSLNKLPNMSNPFVNLDNNDLISLPDELPELDFENDPLLSGFDLNKPKMHNGGIILDENIQERFNQVFGNSSIGQGSAKEIIIGDVLSGNRSKINRELRNRRLKIITNNSLSKEDK